MTSKTIRSGNLHSIGWGILLLACWLVGCQSGPVARMFVTKDNTSYRTPAVRSAEARAIAAESRSADAATQQQMATDLARRLQAEGDPLVREALLESIAAIRVPLATQTLQAGLGDDDEGVRQTCCVQLGKLGSAEAVPTLRNVAAADDSFDVRVAATTALGQIGTTEAVQSLVTALEDNDPAMQFAGVSAVKQATGRDLGGDVRAYVALAKGEAPASAAIVASNPSAADTK